LNNKTPYQCFINDVFNKKPKHILSVFYIRVIDYKTYILIEKEKRITLKKLTLYIEVNILISFKGHYIYRVYILLKRRVVRTSHCRFNEGQGLITESNNIDLSLSDRLDMKSNNNRNQDFKDTSLSPS
jgi:hypothetical protein